MPGSDPVCDALNIPDYLHQLGRPADPTFDDEREQLFVRCKPTDTEIKNVISFKKQSCNREKHCKGGPDDVLYDPKHGNRHQEYTAVLTITVGQVREVTASLPRPPEKKQAEAVATTDSYTLEPEHKPDQCNYPHTEIIAHRNGQPDPDNIKPSSMKKRLRELLAEKYQFVLPSERAGERLAFE